LQILLRDLPDHVCDLAIQRMLEAGQSQGNMEALALHILPARMHRALLHAIYPSVEASGCMHFDASCSTHKRHYGSLPAEKDRRSVIMRALRAIGTLSGLTCLSLHSRLQEPPWAGQQLATLAALTQLSSLRLVDFRSARTRYSGCAATLRAAGGTSRAWRCRARTSTWRRRRVICALRTCWSTPSRSRRMRCQACRSRTHTCVLRCCRAAAAPRRGLRGSCTHTQPARHALPPACVAALQRLATLDVAGCRMEADVAAAVAAGLMALPRIASLSLSPAAGGYEGVSAASTGSCMSGELELAQQIMLPSDGCMGWGVGCSRVLSDICVLLAAAALPCALSHDASCFGLDPAAVARADATCTTKARTLSYCDLGSVLVDSAVHAVLQAALQCCSGPVHTRLPAPLPFAQPQLEPDEWMEHYHMQ
jgi:hypothetical protein